MDTPSAEFAEEPRALDVAYDDYINEVGPDAVAAQFGITVDDVNNRKLKPAIAFFLFDRQRDLHRNALAQAGASPDKFGNTPVQEEGLPGLPRMIPLREKGTNWIDPKPPRQRETQHHNTPVL